MEGRDASPLQTRELLLWCGDEDRVFAGVISHNPAEIDCDTDQLRVFGAFDNLDFLARREVVVLHNGQLGSN